MMRKTRIFLYGTWGYHRGVTKERSPLPNFTFDKQTEYKEIIITF